MYKIRIPYSLIAAVICMAAGLPWLYIGLSGVIVEVFSAGLIFWKLTSTAEFMYDSFYGALLRQYTISSEVDIYSILHLAGARILGYILAIFSFLYFVPTIILLCITSVHYLKSPN